MAGISGDRGIDSGVCNHTISEVRRFSTVGGGQQDLFPLLFHALFSVNDHKTEQNFSNF